MTELTAERPLPRAAVVAGGILIALTLASAVAARLGGIGTLDHQLPAVSDSRMLIFADRADGAIVITDATARSEVAVLAPGTNGFVRGALRGLARERRAEGVGEQPPFRLIRRVDGRIELADPQTGRSISLEAFGHTQVETFAALLKR